MAHALGNSMSDAACELTILMPCLNEAETLPICIKKAKAFLQRSGVAGEVVIADNGSSDGSPAIALSLGARVIDVPVRGYGAALIDGIAAARGRFVIMGDSDDSYDFSQLDLFLTQLRAGAELVMGNRFAGEIKPGAMPLLHRYLGNPVLTSIGRLFFNAKCGDFHCGLRGFDRAAILRLDLQAAGMEFASEMVVKAILNGVRITEVPVTLWPDGRSRPPHLRSWRDGWRHLRFLLLFSPRSLFFYPGAIITLLGLAGMLWLLPEARTVAGVRLDIHTLLYAALAVVVGIQSMLFWLFAKVYGAREGIVPPDTRLFFRALVHAAQLEWMLLAAGLFLLTGLALAGLAMGSWSTFGFGELDPDRIMRLVIPSATAIVLAFNFAYSGFFISILQIRSRNAQGILNELPRSRSAEASSILEHGRPANPSHLSGPTLFGDAP
jgi:glycosyltransferase involved in cell wall biosynthesis